MLTIFSVFMSIAMAGFMLVQETKHDNFKKQVIEAIEDQTRLYNDICAESRSCEFQDGIFCTDEFADVEGYGSILIKAHYEGVDCAAESIRQAVEGFDGAN